MWALFAFHTKWAETLKLISDSSQNQMATLSLGSRSAHYRQSCPTPEFARNVLVSKPLRPLFSAERNFIPQLHGCLHPQKRSLPRLSRSFYEVTLRWNLKVTLECHSKWGMKEAKGAGPRCQGFGSKDMEPAYPMETKPPSAAEQSLVRISAFNQF